MLSTQTCAKTRQSNNLFDITKLVLAIMVIGIHTPLPEYFFPWMRVAVPLFFMMTGYFLFSKLKTIDDKSTRKEITKKFLLRNGKLYIFYSLILSPFIIFLTGFDFLSEHFAQGIFPGIYSVIQVILFKGTFVGSWYIVSSMLGIIIISFFSAHMNNKKLFAVTLVFYIISCIHSSYINYFANVKPVIAFYDTFKEIVEAPEFSFLVACFWLYTGKILAEHSFKFKRSMLFVSLIIFGILLYYEWLFVKIKFGDTNNDCYFTLIPMCTIIFLILKDINFTTNKIPIDCRKTSTIIYALHGVVLRIWMFILKNYLNISNQYIIFFSSLITLIAISTILLALKKKKYFSWLKYSY